MQRQSKFFTNNVRLFAIFFFEATKFGQLPDYLKNKMVNSDEYKLAVTGGQEHESHNSNEVDDDSSDLPF